MNRTVESFESSFSLGRDDPETPDDEGATFVFVNGLGGRSIRDQERCLPTEAPYGCDGEWASIYAEQQNANYGALFGVFHYNGDPRAAYFYFKDVDGAFVDEFWVQTTWGPCCPADLDGDCTLDVDDLLMFLGAWGTDPGGPPDFDDSGVVDVLDLLKLLNDWPGCL